MGMFDGLMERMQGMIDDTKEAVKQRDNQQWEYAWRNRLDDQGGSVFDQLDLYGSRRWELVAISSDGVWVFKRPKLDPDLGRPDQP